MINTKLSIKYKLILLVAVMAIVFFSEAFLSFSKMLVAEQFLGAKAVSKIRLGSNPTRAESDDGRYVAAIKNRVLVSKDHVLSCYGRDGALQWSRELASEEVMVYPLNGNILLVDKSKGDLALMNVHNEVLRQKKDIGEIREIQVSQKGLLAISSADGRSISLFDEKLERNGKIVPPAGDIVRFKFSKTEPRLLIYTTELINQDFGSYIYHYNAQSQLVSTSDLQRMIVYDFEQKDDLTIIGSDWITRIYKEQQSKLDTRLSTKSEQLNGTVECIGSNESFFAIQTLIAKGDNQGRTRMALYDWSHKLVGEQIYDVPAEEIFLGNKYFVLKAGDTLTIWSYDFKKIASLSLPGELAKLQWIDTFQFLIYTDDMATIYKIK